MVQKVITSYKSAFSGLTRETWLLSVVMLINRAGTMAVPFMSLYVTVKLGRSLAEAGLIITLFGVGSVLGALLGGFLTDRIGFRWVQIVSAIMSGIMFMLYGLIRDFPTLCVLTVLLSLVADALRPANHAAIASYSTVANLTRSYTLNRLAINLGWSLGGAIGGLLAAIDYQLLFWVEGGTNIVAGLLIWFLLPWSAQSTRKFSLKVERPKGVLQPWQDKVFMRFIFFAT
ncbi:MAG TPA: MFS transporter, partial [Phnomibacter sp.]|nr:MFS transporter [Phnomibacter sp.]